MRATFALITLAALALIFCTCTAQGKPKAKPIPAQPVAEAVKSADAPTTGTVQTPAFTVTERDQAVYQLAKIDTALDALEQQAKVLGEQRKTLLKRLGELDKQGAPTAKK